MAEARFRLGGGGGASFENYLNFSECLKIFQIKLAEKTNMSLMPVLCSVPWFPLTSSAFPILPTCTDQFWPLLPSPSPTLPPDANISHWMTLNWSPCSCHWPSRSSSYRAARASFKQHKSDRICKIASNISLMSTDDLQLSHAIFLKKHLGELLAFFS